VRIANHDGRAVLVLGDAADGPDGAKAADIAIASGGRFGPGFGSIYAAWEEFVAWASAAAPQPDVVLERHRLGAPSPYPSQVVAIGLNYADHAAETGFEVPTTLPPVFTKFPSAITGPYGEVALPPDGHTDWEVEVVAIVGRQAHRVAVEDAWSHVAGLAVGQDLSERISQMAGPAPQFGLAKSFPGFAPIGPWLVTLDELETAGLDRDDLALGCAVGGETVQDGRTSRLIFSIPRTIAALSQVITLRPGDVIFTGTPDGVGLGMDPPRFLRSGETLRTWVEGLGELEHTFR
jgi:2-keto-4-pentenoate hydratase/2-oxohepta-3-ene-1,7-dioic acid hydratase in catechol pathway